MTPPLHPDQFRYETRIKDKPNSQGTLFQADPSQRTPASRQPRGYSADRYKDVSQALGLDHPAGHDAGTDEARAHLAQTVARSTVPMEHLEDSQSDYVTMHVTDEGGRGGVEDSAVGDYWRAYKGIGAHIGIRPSVVKEPTAIHEIGHHVQAENYPWAYSTPHDKGRAEGYADKYADEHARTGGYKQKQMRPDTSPGRPYSWQNHNDPTEFTVSYNNERYGSPRNPLSEAQFGDNALPKNHVKGQLPLLNRVGQGRNGTDNIHWDYTTSPHRPLPDRRRATDDELAAGKPTYISGVYG